VHFFRKRTTPHTHTQENEACIKLCSCLEKLAGPLPRFSKESRLRLWTLIAYIFSFFTNSPNTPTANRSSTSAAMRKSKTMSFPPNPHMVAKTAKPSSLAAQIKTSTSTKSLNKETGHHYAFPLLHPSKSRLTLDLRNGFHGSKEGRKNGYKCSDLGEDLFRVGVAATVHISIFLPTDIEKANLRRLMGAISFGYGVFQLCISLLPPNLLKLISFFGFEGDRDAGVLCLSYSKSTEDMRAPLAT